MLIPHGMLYIVQNARQVYPFHVKLRNNPVSLSALIGHKLHDRSTTTIPQLNRNPTTEWRTPFYSFQRPSIFCKISPRGEWIESIRHSIASFILNTFPSSAHPPFPGCSHTSTLDSWVCRYTTSSRGSRRSGGTLLWQKHQVFLITSHVCAHNSCP